MIVAIADFFREGRQGSEIDPVYTYGVDPLRNNQTDIVSYFLFDSLSKEGTCQDFASAATLIYRAYDIPARFVTGFICYTDEDDPYYKPDTKIDITQNMAHAWVEIYWEGMGWVPVEVTPLLLPVGVGGETIISTPSGDRSLVDTTITNGGDSGDKKENTLLGGPISVLPVIPENKEIMKIRSGHSGDFYLRAESFGSYTGDGFAKFNDDECYKDSIYNPLTLVGNNYGLNGYDVYKEYNMKIKYKNPDYFEAAVTPYFVTGDYSLSGDNYLKKNYSSEYKTNFIVFPYSTTSTLTDEFLTHLQTYTDTTFDQTYEEYVNANFKSTTELSSTLQAALDGIILANSLNTGTLANKIDNVATFLRDSGEYEYAVEGFDYTGTDDIALSFISTRKGQSEHFAMLGTLLLRRMGIPARYVRGVKVSINNNQTTKALSSKEWLSVRDSSIHDWVEVYISNFGWIPVEVTASTESTGIEFDWDKTSDVLSVTITPHPDDRQYEIGLTSIEGNHVVAEYGAGIDKTKYLVEGTYQSRTTEFGDNVTVVTSYKVYKRNGLSNTDVTEQFSVTLGTGNAFLYLDEITITTGSNDKTYNGTPLTPLTNDTVSLSGGSSATLASYGHTFHSENAVFYGDSVANEPGESISNQIDIENSIGLITDGLGNDVTSQYRITVVPGTLRYNKKNLTVIAEDYEIYYDDFLDLGVDELTWNEVDSVVGLATGDTVVSVSFDSDSFVSEDQMFAENKITSVIIHDAYGNDVTSYYNITYVSGYLEIYE